MYFKSLTFVLHRRNDLSVLSFSWPKSLCYYHCNRCTRRKARFFLSLSMKRHSFIERLSRYRQCTYLTSWMRSLSSSPFLQFDAMFEKVEKLIIKFLLSFSTVIYLAAIAFVVLVVVSRRRTRFYTSDSYSLVFLVFLHVLFITIIHRSMRECVCLHRHPQKRRNGE